MRNATGGETDARVDLDDVNADLPRKNPGTKIGEEKGQDIGTRKPRKREHKKRKKKRLRSISKRQKETHRS